jgi:hypothetical protein
MPVPYYAGPAGLTPAQHAALAAHLETSWNFDAAGDGETPALEDPEGYATADPNAAVEAELVEPAEMQAAADYLIAGGTVDNAPTGIARTLEVTFTAGYNE